MKKLLLLLMISTSTGIFAGNVPHNKTTKTQITVEPQLPNNPPNGYLVDCCHSIPLGYSNGCYNVNIECWGACAGHGWSIEVCPNGVITIWGALVINDNGPIKGSVPLSIGILRDMFDPNLDITSQIIEYKKIESSLIRYDTDFKIETDEAIYNFKAGIYEIKNSNLLVIATKLRS